jgi:hypothetical protein
LAKANSPSRNGWIFTKIASIFI